MKICYVPEGFEGAAMYRLVFPFREMEKHGHVAKTPLYTYVPPKDGKMGAYVFHLENLPVADVYVFQMPLDRAMADLMRTLRANGHLVVGECDDSPHPPSWHPVFKSLDPRTTKDRNQDTRRRAFQCCDAVTVSTQALADQLRSVNPNVHVLPNFLLGEMWAGVTPQFTVKRERVRVGWMGRGLWRHGDLEVLMPVVKGLLDRHPHVDFVAAGDEAVHDVLGVPEDRRVSLPPFKFPVGLTETVASMDIGLVPLALDDDARLFNEGKSCLKGMEYAAAGIPCVASPSSEYRRWVDGDNGFLASTPEEWGEALDRLVTDHALRGRMGIAALVKATQHTVEEHWGLWESLYEGLLDRKARVGRRAA